MCDSTRRAGALLRLGNARVLNGGRTSEACSPVRSDTPLDKSTRLTRFIEDGRLATDNNHSERAHRKVTIGLKNGLFVGSDDDAQRAANIFAAIASTKLHLLDPQDYLRDIFRVLPHWPKDRYPELAPKYRRATRAKLIKSELDAEVGPLTIPSAWARAT